MMKVQFKVFILMTFLVVSTAALAQDKEPEKAPTDSVTVKSDTTKPKKPKKKPDEPKKYDEVITKEAITSTGFFQVHKVDDKYYFEIPDSMWNREILVVNRVIRAAANQQTGMFGYGGDQIGQKVIEFAKGPSDKVFIRSISYQEMSKDSSEDGMYRSFRNSNLHPLVAAFPIAAYSKDTTSAVIDVTKYIDADNDVLFFEDGLKKRLGLTSLQKDRSYIMGINAYPKNLEIRTFKTFTKTSKSSSGRSGGSSPVSYELNSSLVLLPKVPMQPRYFDPRVGYFATATTNFDVNPQGVEKVVKAVRWRLEPRAEDIDDYLRGELVEPKKPIVYYIDPATPQKWVPYLIKGVNDWQKAFEKAGFKNAIYAKVAPINDSTWSLEDARHSAIVYKPSSVANASGPNIHDPRSGEIIESHINWYHNVMELLRNWYLIQAAPNDPRARDMQFPEELMGQLIRFVSSHEVGHTLGLRHNFGSSSTIPVEKLRDKKWLKKHGHTPSIMDYARFNYVAQPEDNIGPAGIFPRIGEYDMWAIEWGYRWYPQFDDPQKEADYLAPIVAKRIEENPRLIFGTESDRDDPRNQSEALGDNAMKASMYGIKNLQYIMPHILEWTNDPHEGYQDAQEIYNQLVSQFGRYIGHVTKYIGGIETTPSYMAQESPVYQFTTRASQQEAMQFLQDQLFTTPQWLLNKDLFAYIGPDNMSAIGNLQRGALSRIIDDRTLGKLIRFEMYNPQEAYTPSQMLDDLKSGIWQELETHEPIDIYRRNLQKMYAEQLLSLIEPKKESNGNSMQMRRRGPQGPELEMTDGISIIKGHIRTLISDIEKALPLVTDEMSKLHLMDVKHRLEEGLNPDDKN